MSVRRPSFFHVSLSPVWHSTPASCSCKQAREGCAPTYVFSISGQVSFRQTLFHLLSCTNPDCRLLKRSVIASITHKLSWLFQEDTLLGCIHIQPYLYGQETITFHHSNFPLVSSHLAQCPRQSCAQLRRSLLLSIRRDCKAYATESIENLD